MKGQLHLRSTDVLDAMHMTATVYVPRRTMLAARVRLWCATQLVRLAGLIGGIAIAVTDELEGQT